MPTELSIVFLKLPSRDRLGAGGSVPSQGHGLKDGLSGQSGEDGAEEVDEWEEKGERERTVEVELVGDKLTIDCE